MERGLSFNNVIHGLQYWERKCHVCNQRNKPFIQYLYGIKSMRQTCKEKFLKNKIQTQSLCSYTLKISLNLSSFRLLRTISSAKWQNDGIAE